MAEKRYWYDAPEEEVHKDVFAMVEYFKTQDRDRLDELLELERLYGGRKITGLEPWNYWKTEVPIFLDGGVLKSNIVRSIVDTLAAELAQHKTKPVYLTTRGSPKMKAKAKRRSQWVDGAFRKCKVHAVKQDATFDLCRTGMGVAKIGNDGAMPTVERVHQGDLYVVNAESRNGKTRQIFHITPVARTELAAFCIGKDGKPDKKLEAIAGNADEITVEGAAAAGVSDIVLLVEAWRLPVMRGKKVVKHGRHTICVSSGRLLWEEYDRERLPFAFCRFVKKPRGFWPTGAAEIARPRQIEVNRMLRTKQEAFALFSGPWVETDENSKVALSHFTNGVGAIIKGALGRSKVSTPPPMSDQVMREIDRETERAYEDVGVSKMAAQQVNELGAGASGAAQRELKDAHSRRFALQHDNLDQFELDIAELLVDEARELKKNGVDLSVEVPDGDAIEVVDWATQEKGEEMVLTCAPTNFFGSSPQAKKQGVIDAIRTGWFTREQGMKQLDFPDLASENALITAYQDHVDRIAGIILDEEKEEREIVKTRGFWPETFDDPNVCSDRMNRHLKRAQATDTDDWRIDLMREYVLRAENIKMKRAQNQAAQQQTQAPTSPLPQAA